MSAHSATDRAARVAYMVARYKAGATLQAIGDEMGITRERVRQLIHRGGARVRHGKTHDPIAIMRAARAEGATSLGDAAKAAGVPPAASLRVLAELGALPAVERLYRARKSRERRRVVAARIRAAGDRVGRWPSATDGGPSLSTQAYESFGSWHAALEYAGYTGIAPTGGYRRAARVRAGKADAGEHEGDIARQFRDELARQRLSQADLARLVGRSQASCSLRLSRAESANIKSLRRYADALGMDLRVTLVPKDAR